MLAAPPVGALRWEAVSPAGIVLVLIGVFLVSRTVTRSDPVHWVEERDAHGKPTKYSWRSRNLVDVILQSPGEKVAAPTDRAAIERGQAFKNPS